jgi:hypothetical protein
MSANILPTRRLLHVYMEMALADLFRCQVDDSRVDNQRSGA